MDTYLWEQYPLVPLPMSKYLVYFIHSASQVQSWKSMCLHMVEWVDVESIINIRYAFYPLMWSLYMLTLIDYVAFLGIIASCLSSPLFLFQNTTCIGYHGVYYQMFHLPHRSQVTTHKIAHPL